MNYGGLFESWEVAVVKNLINDYRRKWRFLKREGFDDLLQECLIHWLDVRDGYEVSRETSKKAFMARVIKNKLKNILAKAQAKKRKAFYESVSLDAPFDDEKDLPDLKDQITNTPDELSQELKIRLSEALKKLTPQQKKLCKLLGEEGLNINEACKHFNKHRSSIYRDVLRVRALFEKEGLKNYLR